MTDLTDYQKYWAKRFKQQEENQKSLLEFLQRSAKQAAQLLVEQFSARKVYLYGSTVDGYLFHKYSDVDLAVEGLPPQRYFSALAKISDLFRGKSRIDLLPLEDASPEIKDRIEKTGKLLYE